MNDRVSSGSTPIMPPSTAALERAVAILQGGGLVSFPTETVYGLGADAENVEATQKIFSAKGRPADHPLIVHLASLDQIDGWAREIPADARRLAERFWPGPLTLILRRGPRSLDVVTGGLDTVGLRVPGHPVALELLRRFGGGIAAPSANRFGRVSPTRAVHVREELGDRVDLILDGGDCSVGLESTIVDASGATPSILRPGAVTAEQLAEELGRPLVAPAEDAPRAPGRMASHYAPEAVVELVERGGMIERLPQVLAVRRRVAVIAPSIPPNIPAFDEWLKRGRVVFVESSPDLEVLARSLYELLREIDRLGCDGALVELPTDAGLGAAIIDRLRKAAGLG